MKAPDIFRAGIFFLILALSSAHHEVFAIEKGQCDGYFIFPINSVPDTYNGGFSTYIAAWPLLAQYPGHQFQTGLPGTWMFPQYRGITEPKDNYTDIEGGLGWWRDTRFATIYPKFIMGGVASEFSQVSNGPGCGWGTWKNPAGKYAVAQLSNRLLWPPDGVNLKQGTCGELFGYGYLPLPFTKAKPTTAGHNVPTGNNCWTLFLNTKSFKGPVTFFMPEFWSFASTSRSDLVGMGLDTRPSIANYPVQMETQYTPAVRGVADNGEIYARISPTRFPRNFGSQSVLIHNFTSYNKTALWDAAKTWFNGGKRAGCAIDTQSARTHTFGGRTWCGWKFKFKDTTHYEIDFDTTAGSTAIHSTSVGYNWKIPLDTSGRLVTMPEYYHLTKSHGTKIWVPVAAKDVPTETGLTRYNFPTGPQNNATPYTTPSDANGSWKKPGPAAGPFTATLGDKSVVTYYWYRFADQPTLLNNDLSAEERETMQSYAEKIHANWKIDSSYLPSPTIGIDLADLDPGLIVTPPPGMKTGYVPIVTRQEKAVSSSRHRGEYKRGSPFSVKQGRITFSVPEAGNHTITFYALNGSATTVLKDIACKRGINSVAFDRNALAAGVYIARIDAKSFINNSCRVIIRH